MELFKKNKVSVTTPINVREALKKGDLFTRLSAVVMGLGNIVRGQIIKGLIYLVAEIYFIIFMITKGITCLNNLVSLGTKTATKYFDETSQMYRMQLGDNSMLCLLYGVMTIFLIIGFFLAWRGNLKSSYAAQLKREAGKHVQSFKDDLEDLLNGQVHRLLLFLPITCILAFTVMPLIFMILMAFTNYDRDHQVPANLFDWVGLKNFSEIFSSSSGLGTAFWHVLGWTLVWAFFATFLNYICGMILGIVINRNDTKWKGMWRFFFVLSIAIPQFVSLLVMRTLLQPDGAINVLLRSMGVIGKSSSLPFWTNVTWARVSIVVVNLWIGVPYTLLQVTGILKNIPADLYEAARLDGAGPVRIFFSITLPYMLFVTAPYLITQFIGNINNFNVIYLLTAGTPACLEYFNGTAGKTDLLVTWLYKLTVDFSDYNYGAVIGIMTFILSAFFALLTYHRTSAYKNEEGFQ
ncbi:MAG: sugar ABC transporter permease [bacterium]|nr:sugar ABC transporter permease [bacterium]